MYDPRAVLAAMDQHRTVLTVLSAFALIGNYIFFGEAIRWAWRHRSYSMPLAGIYLFFVHDLSYLLQYDKWFHEYDHWYCRLYWYGLIVTFALEGVFLAQTILYGRRELFPNLSQRQFTLLALAGLPAMGITWWCIKQNLQDDIYVLTFFLTTIPNPALCMAMLGRRKTRQGTSVLMWQGYTLMVMTAFPMTLYYGKYFNSPTWYLVGLVSIGWGVLMMYMVARAPPYIAMAETV